MRALAIHGRSGNREQGPRRFHPHSLGEKLLLWLLLITTTLFEHLLTLGKPIVPDCLVLGSFSDRGLPLPKPKIVLDKLERLVTLPLPDIAWEHSVCPLTPSSGNPKQRSNEPHWTDDKTDFLEGEVPELSSRARFKPGSSQSPDPTPKP